MLKTMQREVCDAERISPKIFPLGICVCVSEGLAGMDKQPCEALAPRREGEAAEAHLFITPTGQQPVTTAVTTPKPGTHTQTII